MRKLLSAKGTHLSHEKVCPSTIIREMSQGSLMYTRLDLNQA